MTCSTNSARVAHRGGTVAGFCGWRRGAQVGDGLLQVVELLRLAGELRCYRVVGHRTPAVAPRRLMPAVAVASEVQTATAGISRRGSTTAGVG